MRERSQTAKFLLDSVFTTLHQGEEYVFGGMDQLMLGLNETKAHMNTSTWENFKKDECLSHPLFPTLQSEPLTKRAYTKPRGYAGDAVLIDLVYRHPSARPLVASASSLGKEIYEYLSTCSASRSAQERKELCTKSIDRVAKHTKNPRILSLACGHLREVEESHEIKNGCIDVLVGIDQDKKSLDSVQNAYTSYNIQTVHGHLGEFTKEKNKLGHFDFIYSLGLYDYLEESLASHLTQAMFSLLNPGGQLLIANYSHTMEAAAYMEAFMGWDLMYRNEEELRRTSCTIDEDMTSSVHTFSDEAKNLVYLEMTRA